MTKTKKTQVEGSTTVATESKKKTKAAAKKEDPLTTEKGTSNAPKKKASTKQVDVNVPAEVKDVPQSKPETETNKGTKHTEKERRIIDVVLNPTPEKLEALGFQKYDTGKDGELWSYPERERENVVNGLPVRLKDFSGIEYDKKKHSTTEIFLFVEKL